WPRCAGQGDAGRGSIFRDGAGLPCQTRRPREDFGLGWHRADAGEQAARAGSVQMAADHGRDDAPVAGAIRRARRRTRLDACARASGHTTASDAMSLRHDDSPGRMRQQDGAIRDSLFLVSDLTDPLPNDIEALRALVRNALTERDAAQGERNVAIAERDRALEQ